MATLLFIPGTQVPLSILGLFKDYKYEEIDIGHEKTVHVIIPAKNEERRIAYAIGSLFHQDYSNMKLTVVDNNSDDNTGEYAQELIRHLPDNLEARIIECTEPGKTPSVKKAMRERTGADLTFILDADTYLVSPDYISRSAAQFKNPVVGSAFGRVWPITKSSAEVHYKKFTWHLALSNEGKKIVEKSHPKERDIGNPIVRAHRRSLYSFYQNLVSRGQMGLNSSTLFPVGCGVMYDTSLLQKIFDDYEPTLGDNLTASEDIFLGFAIRDKGRTNVFIPQIHMESTEPSFKKYFKQNHTWSSAFIQSAHYFPKQSFKIIDPEHSSRAMGLFIFPPLAEKITYSGLLAAFAAVGHFPIVLGAFALETLVFSALNFIVAEPKYKFQSIVDTVVAQPVRIPSIASELYTVGKHLYDTFTGNTNWRK